MAREASPDSHPLCLGMPGMHGTATATTAMQKSDLLITLGARFDDRITGRLDGFAPEAKIIHVDIDPAEQGKVRRPDVPIVGDLGQVIPEIIKEIKALLATGSTQADTSAWKSRVSGWREQFPWPTRRRCRARRSSPSSAWSSCATSPPRTRSSCPASASTRCGRRSTGTSTSPTRG
ncbi:MAG: hypothetical protein R2715_05225 [Ilumatobacteraceae bacterium]